MSSGEVEWKHFDEDEMPRACRAIIIMIIVLIFVACIVWLIVWDGRESSEDSETDANDDESSGESTEKNTIDKFSFSQRVLAQTGKSAQSEVRATDGSIVGEVRQIFVVPPTSAPAQVVINQDTLYYEYNGDKANGFEVRWLDYVTKGSSTVKSLDLSDVESFDVDVEGLDLDPKTTFTMQINIKDEEGLESSVVNIVDSLGIVKFRKSSFLRKEMRERPDFSRITGMWLGGDFRCGGGNIMMGNLKFDKV